MRYTPHAQQEVAAMLQTVGVDSLDDLFLDIPEELRLKRDLAIGPGMEELQLRRHLQTLAAQNTTTEQMPSFLGAGAYDHLVPAAVEQLLLRSEFYTAYTPYQAEISQGILQSIFEYQTYICRLTGMDASNASMYDGASALGECCKICVSQKRRPRVLLPETLHPRYADTVNTYAIHETMQLHTVAQKDGRIDLQALEQAIDGQTACVVVQQPNFYGLLEDIGAIEKVVHQAGAQLVMCVHPTTLALLRTPGEIGADYVVGDGQPLGCGLNYGGPNLGFMATTKKNIRQLPGRIVGQSVDTQGRRSFVLTLQAREQHIRREKASSNICSNQALNALAASMYLAFVGPNGLREVAQRCYDLAHYAEQALAAKGVKRLHAGAYFMEFAIAVPDAKAANQALLEAGILGGYVLADGLLLAFTEKRTKEEIDRLADVLGGVCCG